MSDYEQDFREGIKEAIDDLGKCFDAAESEEEFRGLVRKALSGVDVPEGYEAMGAGYAKAKATILENLESGDPLSEQMAAIRVVLDPLLS